MIISPKEAITRLGIRLRERRARSQTEDDAPQSAYITDEDLVSISDYEAIVADTIDLLRLENEQLASGNSARVAQFFRRKQELLRLLSLRQMAVEPYIRAGSPETQALKDLLRVLQEELHTNANLLAGMATASHAILSEVDRIRKRQSLEGVYDKTGQLRRDLDIRENRALKKI